MEDMTHVLTVIKLCLELGMSGHENTIRLDLEQDTVNGLAGTLLWEDKEYEIFVSLDEADRSAVPDSGALA